MKIVVVNILLLLFIGCASRALERGPSGCVLPTHSNAVRSLSWGKSIGSLFHAGLFGHQYENNSSLHDELVQKKLYDLKIFYVECIRSK